MANFSAEEYFLDIGYNIIFSFWTIILIISWSFLTTDNKQANPESDLYGNGMIILDDWDILSTVARK